MSLFDSLARGLSGGNSRSGGSGNYSYTSSNYSSTPSHQTKIKWQCEWCGHSITTSGNRPGVNGCLKNPMGNRTHRWVN